MQSFKSLYFNNISSNRLAQKQGNKVLLPRGREEESHHNHSMKSIQQYCHWMKVQERR